MINFLSQKIDPDTAVIGIFLFLDILGAVVTLYIKLGDRIKAKEEATKLKAKSSSLH